MGKVIIRPEEIESIELVSTDGMVSVKFQDDGSHDLELNVSCCGKLGTICINADDEDRIVSNLEKFIRCLRSKR